MEQLTPEAGEFMFEHDGVKMIDTPMGIFLKDGKPFVGLFKRRSLFHAAPMATMGPRQVYVVIKADVSGFFSKNVHLTLKDAFNTPTQLKIPLSCLMPSALETLTGEFLAWANTCSPILHPPGLNFVTLPGVFFAWNTAL